MRTVSLKVTFAGLTIAVTAVALAVACALVVLTTLLRETTTQVARTVESVRIAEEAQIDLLLLSRSLDPVVRGELQGDLAAHLEAARQHVSTPEEGALLDDAGARVGRYVAAFDSQPDMDPEQRNLLRADAYNALEAVVAVNLSQSTAAQRDAAHWDGVANVIALGAAALLCFLSVAVVIWLRRGAFAPVYSLAAAMKRFGGGDDRARVAPSGSTELRDICTQFNEMADGLSARRQAQIALLGGVAHDLRTPLTTIQIALALLSPERGPPDAADSQRVVNTIERQVERIQRMINDFLDVSALEAGKLDLKLDTRDVRAIARDAIELFAAKAGMHRLVLDVPDEPLLVTCDGARVEQVLANLVGNAIKYSPNGGVVKLTAQRRGGDVEVSVADEGIGIAEQDRARLFQPFKRVGLSRELAIPGIGLGLFMVRGIVEAHGGSIDVTSVVGKGSTFLVRLPAHGRASEDADAGAAVLH